jgi:hypothetical protein
VSPPSGLCVTTCRKNYNNYEVSSRGFHRYLDLSTIPHTLADSHHVGARASLIDPCQFCNMTVVFVELQDRRATRRVRILGGEYMYYASYMYSVHSNMMVMMVQSLGAQRRTCRYM